MTLTFDLLTPKAYHFEYIEDNSLYQVRTLWNHSFLSYSADKQTDRQTNKQTDSKILPKWTDIVGVGKLYTYCVANVGLCFGRCGKHQVVVHFAWWSLKLGAIVDVSFNELCCNRSNEMTSWTWHATDVTTASVIHTSIYSSHNSHLELWSLLGHSWNHIRASRSRHLKVIQGHFVISQHSQCSMLRKHCNSTTYTNRYWRIKSCRSIWTMTNGDLRRLFQGQINDITKYRRFSQKLRHLELVTIDRYTKQRNRIWNIAVAYIWANHHSRRWWSMVNLKGYLRS